LRSARKGRHIQTDPLPNADDLSAV